MSRYEHGGSGGPMRSRGSYGGQHGHSRGGPYDRSDRRGGGDNRGRSDRWNEPGEGLKKPRWDMSALVPFRKNFYIPTPKVAARFVPMSKFPRFCSVGLISSIFVGRTRRFSVTAPTRRSPSSGMTFRSLLSLSRRRIFRIF